MFRSIYVLCASVLIVLMLSASFFTASPHSQPGKQPSLEPSSAFPPRSPRPRPPRPRPTPTPVAPENPAEWSQHAHDAQRTGYTSQVVPYPWRWRWVWNGSNDRGGLKKVTSNGSLPRNVQPVTGGGRVYVAAGVDGVFALSEASGQQLWRRGSIGDVRSTVAYDHETEAVFAVSANGRLYKLRASDGSVLGQFQTGKSSDLFLPPLLLKDRVVFSMGNAVYAVDKKTMQQLWVYNAGSNVVVAVPPSYSASRDLVLVATEPDLHVHAIRNANGSQRWRLRPVHSSRRFEDPTQYRFGWPVVADSTGLVLIKVRLDWQAMWRDYPQTNTGIRQMLRNNPGEQALFALRLDDGSFPFICNVGHGGYGDNDYLPMGPQPVVKRLPDGKEVAYLIARAKHAYDARWDSHFAEMMLDDTTVPGFQAGDVRFIAFDWPPGSEAPYLLTDEQPNVTMSGDILFGGHWEAGFALRILDRSDARGAFNTKITSQRLATVATSQMDVGGCGFSASHYCPSWLYDTRPYDFGFYIYYNQQTVYDRFWSEYACWVVSNNNVYFRSCDGAIVALTSGNRLTSGSPRRVVAQSAAPPMPPSAETTVPFTQARRWDGRAVRVTGTLRYVFNNGKQVLLGFSNPHRGTFKAIIRKEHWHLFPQPPEQMYRVGQSVQISGVVQWYQGDPAIYVTQPGQIRSDLRAQKGGQHAR